MEVAALTEQPLSLTLDPGDEVTESIRRACEGARVATAFITGAGEVEDAEILVLGPVVPGKVAPRTHQLVAGPADLVSLVGHLTRGELELRAVLARQGDHGPELVGGVLVRATAVTARVSAQPVGAAAPVGARVERARPAQVEVAAAPAALAPSAPPVGGPTFSPPQAGSTTQAPPTRIPTKPVRQSDEPDSYPEENDTVNHFHFGQCTVLLSDGERLRLQQEKDGRVREVALSMLRMGAPTQLEGGRRHWELGRKN